MRLAQLVETSAAVAASPGRKRKIELLAACLRQLAPDERAIGATYLAGEIAHDLRVGYATASLGVADARSSATRDGDRIADEVAHQAAPADAPGLTLGEVDRRFAELAALRGTGSAKARRDALGALFSRATADEQRFLAALVVGELRQGATGGLVVEAIAAAAELPADAVRRAHMLAGDLGAVAAAALGGGLAALGGFGLTLYRPVLPMLAQTADDAAAALAQLGGQAMLEPKLDGFRVQIHKGDDGVRVYSRGLNEVTPFLPELVPQLAALPARRLILDGEAIALGPGGRPRPFQDTMRRFGARGVPLAGELPLSLAVFDALLVDDQELLALPARVRVEALAQVAPALAVPRALTADPAEAAAFYGRAIAAGHEGIMAKAPDAPYDAGSRGAAWLKIKQVHRLDLVVLAAEWGSGRRKGWLSNLHLGARDAGSPGVGAPGFTPGAGPGVEAPGFTPGAGFVMLGKTFKGLTDEILRWQTAELLARETGRDGHVVYVRPELVAEIAFSDVQRSPRYPAGLALRLARLVRYRSDKTAADADTIDAVRAIAIAQGVIG